MPPAIAAEVPTSSRLSAARELEAAALEEILLGAGPDRLGVEQQAVVVEDDRVGQVGHAARSSQFDRRQRKPLASRTMPFHVEISRRLPPRPGLQPDRGGAAAERRRALARRPPDRARRPRVGTAHGAALRILEGPQLETQDLSFGQGWSNAERASEDVTRAVLETAAAAGDSGRLRRRDRATRRRSAAEIVAGHGAARDPLERGAGEDRRPRPGGRGRDPGGQKAR